MQEYTFEERLRIRSMSKKDAYKIIDFYIKKFTKKFEIAPNEKFYWESYYIFDKFFRGEFNDILDFQKYLQKSYTQYLKHSEINCVMDFCINFLEDCVGEKVL